jgi:DNA-binding response OmpR family regulator
MDATDESARLKDTMHRHRTILLIEDEADEALLIQRALADAGVKNPVQTARSSAEALSLMRGFGTSALPGLVLLDVRVSGQNGLEVLRWLREHPDVRCNLVVVVLIATAAEEEIRMAYEMGAHSCLVKPVDYEELVAALLRLKEYWLNFNLLPGDLS